MTRVLIVDDEESICWGLAKCCQQLGIECETASSAEKGLALADDQSFQVLIMDVRLPGMDGLTAIQEFQQRLGPIPIITITAFGDLKTAIEAIQNGAFEYIVKPFELEQIKSTLQQAIATNEIAKQAIVVDQSADDSDESVALIGNSEMMQSVFKQIALTTTTRSPVLITGESGTGKELTARLIHQYGSSADRPFVAVNIAALSPTLAESELFGHTKGAFTGAETTRKGLIELAHGGTLFLDEVAEIPIDLQVKLLRVLDLGEVVPVGSNEPIKTDFRLITATHQNLLDLVNQGTFRHDLFYRLRTFEIQLPALRSRLEDIPALATHFAKKASADISITPGFLNELASRRWPGNVRELQNVVSRAVTLARGGVLTEQHVESLQPLAPVVESDLDQRLRQLISQWTREHWHAESTEGLYESFIESIVEAGMLPAAFEISGNQYSSAARKLGIHRTTLKKKLDQLGSQHGQQSENDSA